MKTRLKFLCAIFFDLNNAVAHGMIRVQRENLVGAEDLRYSHVCCAAIEKYLNTFSLIPKFSFIFILSCCQRYRTVFIHKHIHERELNNTLESCLRYCCIVSCCFGAIYPSQYILYRSEILKY
jgi:hypothetical protein